MFWPKILAYGVFALLLTVLLAVAFPGKGRSTESGTVWAATFCRAGAALAPQSSPNRATNPGQCRNARAPLWLNPTGDLHHDGKERSLEPPAHTHG